MNVSGRRWEADPLTFELIQSGRFSISELLLFGDTELPVEYPIEFAATTDPLFFIGKARWLLYQDRHSEALPLLLESTSRSPDIIEGQVLLGRCLSELKRSSDFEAWLDRAPKKIFDYPEAWVAIGRARERMGRLDEAIRCFWEAVRLSPNSYTAVSELGLLLERQGNSSAARPFLERAEQLIELRSLLLVVEQEGPKSNVIHRIALLMEELGRLWEAWAWGVVGEITGNMDNATEQQKNRLFQYLRRRSPPKNLASANPAFQIDLSSYSLPDLSRPPRVPAISNSASSSHVRFIDQATELGLRFHFLSDQLPHNRIPIYNQTGGGVAVLDYDLDQWPDIYLAQGAVLSQQDPPQDSDQLFRNLAGKAFRSINTEAQLSDRDFSQGVTVGDFNSDGFPDIYVANLGRNRLLRNNGDGTFRQVRTFPADDSWTTSCMIADLNADGHPDIYDVNYLDGGWHHFWSVCEQLRNDGCGPSSFEPAQDRIRMNCGDGQWNEVTTECGLQGHRARGLGVVAADFDQSGRLSVFVSNDGDANSFFVNATAQDRFMRFNESGVVSGLAVNRNGRLQGSMGIAIANHNETGRFDLFVTNFVGESNVLYQQFSELSFRDQTSRNNLQDTSVAMVGFGAQFLDPDLDGEMDLIVANGHVDYYPEQQRPLRMPAQFFHRSAGHSGFRESAIQTDYFRTSHCGRSVALLDWNRDGLTDVIVTHLDEPVALLTNVTARAGNYIDIRLVGTTSARGAIGTTVDVRLAERSIVRQLTAGDGYQACNEKRLLIGLGDVNTIDSIDVRWPSGKEQKFGQIPANRSILLVEGQPVFHFADREQ